MKSCVIVAGGVIENYKFIKTFLKEDDYYIFCDSGLNHKERLGVSPSLIVGDFDSYTSPINEDCEIITLPRMKDDTDSMYAIKEGIQRGFDEFVLIGMLGGRIDHTLANIYILEYLANRGKIGCIIDDHSRMKLVTETAEICDDCKYFSLVSITGVARGITIKNAKYELDNGEISSEYQYGVSNEVIAGQTAKVSIKEGKLLLIEIYNE